MCPGPWQKVALHPHLLHPNDRNAWEGGDNFHLVNSKLWAGANLPSGLTLSYLVPSALLTSLLNIYGERGRW